MSGTRRRLPPSGEVHGVNQLSFFSAALGLAAPCQVVDVRFDPKFGRIDFQVAFAPGGALCLPQLQRGPPAGA